MVLLADMVSVASVAESGARSAGGSSNRVFTEKQSSSEEPTEQLKQNLDTAQSDAA